MTEDEADGRPLDLVLMSSCRLVSFLLLVRTFLGLRLVLYLSWFFNLIGSVWRLILFLYYPNGWSSHFCPSSGNRRRHLEAILRRMATAADDRISVFQPFLWSNLKMRRLLEDRCGQEGIRQDDSNLPLCVSLFWSNSLSPLRLPVL